MKKKREKRNAASRQAPRRLEDEDLRDASGASASLSYGKIEWKYTGQKRDGAAGDYMPQKPDGPSGS